jgi:hypothetical protein
MVTQHFDKGTIAISFVYEALVCIRSRGLDPNALQMQAGISPELLASHQARVSSRHYGVLWHLIAQTLERALRRALRFLRLLLAGGAAHSTVKSGLSV